MRRLKRILALALTVLMVVGLVPLSIFAVDPEPAYDSYTGKQYDGTVDATAAAYTDPAYFYQTDSKYWTKITTMTNLAGRGYSKQSDGSYNLSISSTDGQLRALIGSDLTAIKDSVYKNNLAGLDIAAVFDIIVDVENSVDTSTAYIGFMTSGSKSETWQSSVALLRKVDGKVYLMINDDTAAQASAHAIAKTEANTICELEDGVKYSIRVLLDANSNVSEKFYVYVGKYDGDVVAPTYFGSHTLFTGRYFQNIDSFNTLVNTTQAGWSTEEGYENKSSGFMFNGLTMHSAKAIAMNVSYSAYYYNEDGDAAGDASNTTRKVNVADVINYVDFDDEEIGKNNISPEDGASYLTMSFKYTPANTAYGTLTNSIGGSNKGLVTIVSDGNGGAAIENGYEYFNMSGNTDGDMTWAKNNKKLGLNFVISADIKLRSTAALAENANLLSACCNDMYKSGSSNKDLNVGFFRVGSDRKTIHIVDDPNAYTVGKSVGILSKDAFTNLAAYVDPAANTYELFVNGISVHKGTFLNETAKKLLTDGGFKETDFAFSYCRFAQHAIYDNVSYMIAPTLVKSNTQPLNGFITEGGNLYYYENAMRVANTLELNPSDNNYYKFGADGKGTLVESVVLVNGQPYATLAEAITAAPDGATITLTGDITESVALTKDVTLDLAGNTITATTFNMIAGNLVDSGETKGLIKVAKDAFTSGAIETTDSMVIYNGTDGYVVTAVKDQNKVTADAENGTFNLIFRPSFANSTDGNKALLGAGGEAANVKIIVRFSGEGLKDGKKEFEFDSGLIEKAYSEHKALSLTVTGITSAHGELKVEYIIESGTGMVCTINAGTFTSTKAPVTPEV